MNSGAGEVRSLWRRKPTPLFFLSSLFLFQVCRDERDLEEAEPGVHRVVK